LDGNSKAVRVQQDVNSGIALGVTGTPAFFVGSEMVSGFRTTAQLSEIIDRHLAGN
jgi:protein-disulfide isomerase